jgi:hypothetical protein
MRSVSNRDFLGATLVFCLLVGGGLFLYWLMEGDSPALMTSIALGLGTIWSALKLSPLPSK